MAFPARGRTILGYEAAEIIETRLITLIKSSLLFQAIPQNEFIHHIQTHLDQLQLRELLIQDDIIAFVPNGAILPRESGISELPMRSKDLVPFQSPPTLQKDYNVQFRGKITGMAIPKGITLITGGGFHGKSTLLSALQVGVYNHIPGDGREFVLVENSSVEIRAEDGRSICGVNISPFINNLPGGKDTTRFCTENASGSTSQASNIIEALEIGCRLLLIDEDRSATNFMCRDAFMQKLVASNKEPITPFISKVRCLFNDYGTSSILVVGGLGEYFFVADRVLMMDNYCCKDVTEEVKQITSTASHESIELKTFGSFAQRTPKQRSWAPAEGKTKSAGIHEIRLGKNDKLDLSGLCQLQEEGQTRLIVQILQQLANQRNRKAVSLKTLVEEYQQKMKEHQGFDSICNQSIGNVSYVRSLELSAAINRMMSLDIL